jgi:Disulphide bond corrector protein DsbC
MIRWLLFAFCAPAVAQAPDPRVDCVATWANPTIPLRVSIDDNAVATLAGAPSGSVPETHLDPSFNLQTEFYTNTFAVHVPLSFKPNGGAGQSIPISIRFQACSARECKPPKTIHLSVVHP